MPPPFPPITASAIIIGENRPLPQSLRDQPCNAQDNFIQVSTAFSNCSWTFSGESYLPPGSDEFLVVHINISSTPNLQSSFSLFLAEGSEAANQTATLVIDTATYASLDLSSTRIVWHHGLARPTSLTIVGETGTTFPSPRLATLAAAAEDTNAVNPANPSNPSNPVIFLLTSSAPVAPSPPPLPPVGPPLPPLRPKRVADTLVDTAGRSMVVANGTRFADCSNEQTVLQLSLGAPECLWTQNDFAPCQHPECEFVLAYEYTRAGGGEPPVSCNLQLLHDDLAVATHTIPFFTCPAETVCDGVWPALRTPVKASTVFKFQVYCVDALPYDTSIDDPIISLIRVLLPISPPPPSTPPSSTPSSPPPPSPPPSPPPPPFSCICPHDTNLIASQAYPSACFNQDDLANTLLVFQNVPVDRAILDFVNVCANFDNSPLPLTSADVTNMRLYYLSLLPVPNWMRS